MGKIVEHYKLVKVPVREGDYLLANEWDEECNLPISVFEEYLTNVKVFNFVIEIAIFTSENEYEWYLKNFEAAPNFAKVFIGIEKNKLKSELDHFLSSPELRDLERLDLEVDANGLKYQSISFAEPRFEPGFFFKVEGHQKYGMTPKFLDEFSEFSFYGLKSDFERALELLDIEWAIKNGDSVAANLLIENFNKNFLGKYKFGSSLFRV